MTKIGPYLIVKAAQMPFYQKAHKLARALSEDALDDILAGKKHIHSNPKRKEKENGRDTSGLRNGSTDPGDGRPEAAC